MENSNVLVNNLCSWPLYFNRITGQGSIMIPANAKSFPMISYEEALAQIQTDNKMFTGTDGMGNHARVQILDEAVYRKLFGLEGVQTEEVIVVNEETVHELLAIKGKAKFRERLESMVKTDAEKKVLVDIAFRVGAETTESWKVDALRTIAATSGL